MRTFQIDKLVRDNIAEETIALGNAVSYQRLEDKAALSKALRNKLIEEANELDFSDREKLIKELADVAEVIKAISRLHKIPTSEIEKARQQKRQDRGSFSGGYFICTVTLSDDSPLIQYFEGKFPEASSAKPQ